MYHLIQIDLRAFSPEMNTQTTATGTLSPEIKTYYDTALLHDATPKLVHLQFGQKRPIPRGRGKTVEFRKFGRFPKALTALTEGVTPDGGSLTVTSVNATVKQYGYYVAISDMLDLTAYDPILTETVKELGNQSGLTLDTIAREALNAGTNVQYAEGQVTSRSQLTAAHKLTVKAVRMAVRTLKNANAPTIDGYYVGIIHPDVAFDLMDDNEWKYPHQYVDTKQIYENEIGMIGGVRFVESTEAKIFAGAGATISGSDKQSVYSTLILGANAYGQTDITGGGLETIIKQKGSAGTADPLDQRSTCGWKATLVVQILANEYIVRVETGSSVTTRAAN